MIDVRVDFDDAAQLVGRVHIYREETRRDGSPMYAAGWLDIGSADEPRQLTISAAKPEKLRAVGAALLELATMLDAGYAEANDDSTPTNRALAKRSL